MKNNTPLPAPKFIRDEPYMPGYYELTAESDVDSKYYRYQGVPSDPAIPRDTDTYGTWTYSAEDETQKRFRALIDAGVLSEELADYLERHYWYRYNMFFVGGNPVVRRALMDAVVSTNPGLDVVEVSDAVYAETEDTEDSDADTSPGFFDMDSEEEDVTALMETAGEPIVFPKTYWELVEGRMTSRNDVLFYDGVAPDEVSVKLLMQHSVRHIVVAGFARGEDEHMGAFRPKDIRRSKANNFRGGKEEFNSLTVRLRQVEVPGKGFVTEVVEVIKYENNMNSAPDLEEVAWTRVVREWVHVPSTVVY